MTTAYEKERLLNIQKNKERLQALGLLSGNENQGDGFNNSLSVVGIKTEAKKRYLAARSIQPKDVSAVPARVSKRQRGIAPEKTVGDKAELPVMIIPREIRSIATQSPQISSLPLNTCLPLTLASIGVTIWELGTFVEGEERGAYWSSAGCKFRHQYPVGYRASKEHFGRVWDISISKGATGPIFSVQNADSDSGKTYTGDTPTSPWTDVCLAFSNKHGGTRISGPLFFGFSDPLTIALLQRLPGYISYKDFQEQKRND